MRCRVAVVFVCVCVCVRLNFASISNGSHFVVGPIDVPGTDFDRTGNNTRLNDNNVSNLMVIANLLACQYLHAGHSYED